MNNKLYFLISAVCVLILSSCRSGPAGVPDATPGFPTPTLKPSASLAPTITATPSITPVVILESEPLVVEFAAEDGMPLTGIYYPASANPAPVIVLMHWARGGQEEWREVALWLQGRGGLERAPDYNRSWKSSVWYPELVLDKPLGVFTFNFRGCGVGEGGCQAYLPAEWLLDAQAALQTAVKLQGADPERILTAGASIGADGAVDACAWLNQSGLGRCLGSFALSPASLLTQPFNLAAGELLSQDPPLPVYCLYALRDDASLESCGDFPGLVAVDYGYVENHGMELLQPEIPPNPLEQLQEFIHSALLGE